MTMMMMTRIIIMICNDGITDDDDHDGDLDNDDNDDDDDGY